MNEIQRLASIFSHRLTEDNIPISVEIPPISVERHKDLVGTVSSDLHKTNKLLASLVLEDAQIHLIKTISASFARHGLTLTNQELRSQLMKMGEDSDTEQALLSSLIKLLNNYSDKTVHYIINNLSR